MAGPYRASTASSISCPRCGEETPPGEIVACVDGCGVWVTAAIAADVLEPSELSPSRITSWYREPCGCPLCGAQMTLHGHDMSRFLGCPTHGMWIDDSTVTQTGLGRVAVVARLIEARKAAKSKRDERERLRAEESARRLAEQETLAKRVEADSRARHEAAAAAARALQAREAAVRPYLELLRRAEHDPVPLAEKLYDLEQRIARLERGAQ